MNGLLRNTGIQINQNLISKDEHPAAGIDSDPSCSNGTRDPSQKIARWF